MRSNLSWCKNIDQMKTNEMINSIDDKKKHSHLSMKIEIQRAFDTWWDRAWINAKKLIKRERAKWLI